MQRRHLIVRTAAAAAAIALPALARAQALEKPKTTIAVGGKNLLYYLPLTIAEQRGYFKAEGLEVTIVDFAGGARALQAVVGGSADVVSGAFEHTVNMQHKGQPMRAFVLQGRAPQIVLGVNPKTMANYKSVADLKGKKIGVTAPGSSTNVMVNFILAKAGLKPSDVSIIGVGAGQGAVAAMRSGQIDAISNLDPVITLLQRSGDLKVISDTRIVAEAEKVFGGPMPSGCLYAPQAFIDKNPATTQALANAMVRASKWIQSAGATDIINASPRELSARRPRGLHRRLPRRQGRAVGRRHVPRQGIRHGLPCAGQHRPRDRRCQARPRRGFHERVREEGQREISERLIGAAVYSYCGAMPPRLPSAAPVMVRSSSAASFGSSSRRRAWSCRARAMSPCWTKSTPRYM